MSTNLNSSHSNELDWVTRHVEKGVVEQRGYSFTYRIETPLLERKKDDIKRFFEERVLDLNFIYSKRAVHARALGQGRKE